MELDYDKLLLSLKVFFKMFNVDVYLENDIFKIYNQSNLEVGKVIINDNDIRFSFYSSLGYIEGNIININQDSFMLLVNYKIANEYEGVSRIEILKNSEGELSYLIDNDFSYRNKDKSLNLSFSKNTKSFMIEVLDSDIIEVYRILNSYLKGNLTYFKRNKEFNEEDFYKKFVKIDFDFLNGEVFLLGSKNIKKIPLNSVFRIEDARLIIKNIELFEMILKIRDFLRRDGLSLFDNMLVTSGYSEDEIKVLFGIDDIDYDKLKIDIANFKK